MSDEVGIADRIRNRVASLPRAALMGAALAVTGFFVAASLYAYRTYDYIQHDNEFCLSCHLMVDPFERFARSAHREMGCKACHQPTIITRSQMALTQIIENPDSLESHAEVTNERCAECHIEGNPEEWTVVANSAGHRVHLTSSDPNLQGLQCVQCHTTSLHQFAAADKTCGQANCHTDIRVQLGKMSNLTIHCAACHPYSTPVPDTASAGTAVRTLHPAQNECLSCHAMRALVELPADDPHGGVCSSCHNAHTQSTPAEAVESCAGSGCHERPDTITAFHRGLAPGILERCTACHSAHDFRAPGTDCLDCHRDMGDTGADTGSMRPIGMRVGVPAPAAPGAAAMPRGATSPYLHLARSLSPRPSASRVAAADETQSPRIVPQDTARTRFRHARHRSVACTECHSTDETHGALKVVTARDCESCHHSPQLTQGPQGCARCHDAAELAGAVIRRSQTFRFASGTRATRSLSFEHAAHSSRACTDCHTDAVTLATVNLLCTSCHTDHHEPGTRCTACHEAPARGAHDVRSHLGCGGTGCHGEAPVAAAPRTRNLCLSCHQDLAGHRPGRTCVECHPLPPPTAARGATREDVLQ